ncbi:hypothetical protein WA026_022811 [Henosepilachna vigintioctopunctata]|uniref:RNA-directed RNA polymerase C-terminal domain-containing protein n=1 Tax=Henosepilachna vigintioctopunctata TaxID=420089 RepID=A0AAW1VIU4_9CUCU
MRVRKLKATIMTSRLSDVHTINWRYTPDVALTRTELGSLDRPKIWNVWGKSFHNIILEGVNAFPLIDEYQRWADSPIIPGMNLYKILPTIIRDILQDGNSPSTGICVDIESFDATPQKSMIYDAFDILRENITFSDAEGEQCWNYSKEFFVGTPVIMPDGLMWLKTLGIPSGSYFTQLIGSIINHLLITYIQLKIWTRPFKLKVLGDDSAFGLPYNLGWPDLEKISAVAVELGFTIYPDKAIVAQRPEEMEFLGHVVRGLRIHLDIGKLLRLALFPEYTVTSPDMSIARVEELLIDSGMTSWPIINLLKYIRVKFNSEGGNKFVMEDKNWLEIILPTKIIPQTLT